MQDIKYYIGIDLGGTAIKGGIVDLNGKILAKQSAPTGKTSDDVIKDISKLCFKLAKGANLSLEKDIVAIGVGAPGMIDSKGGIIVYSNNLNWKDVDFAKRLKVVTGKDVHITNDANAAALGEANFGSGSEFESSVFITLGTGVGGGIVIDRKLFEGFKSAGAEVGHMVIVENGQPCACGRRGCFEAYGSATALIRDTKTAMEQNKYSKMWEIAKKSLENVSGRTAFDAAKLGDKAAKEVVDSYICHLAEGAANLVNILRPQAVLIGGGISNEGDYLIKPLKKLIHQKMYGGNDFAPVEVKRAVLGNDAGTVGAFAFALQCQNQKNGL